MAYRQTPPPRAHWLLLLITLLVLVVGFGVDALLLRRVGPSGPEHQSGPAGQAPAEVRDGGAVIDARDGVRTSRLPDKTIALTFDDGPDPVWTPQVLDVLRKHQVPATFFVTGVNAASHPMLLRRVAAEGHEVGNHSVTHADLGAASPTKADWEIRQTDLVISGALGRQSALLRPPYAFSPGSLDENGWTAVQRGAARGHLVVLSDVDPTDWQRPGVAAIVDKATPPDQRGAIVLLHDGGGDRGQTVDAIDQLIPKLKADGWRFETVSGAIGATDTSSPAGIGPRALGLASIATTQLARALGTGLLWLLGIVSALILLRVALVLILAVAHRRRRRRNPYPVTQQPPVTVVVPAYNEETGIVQTIHSLLASVHPVQVIVVDDGSTDRTVAVVDDLVRRLRLTNVSLMRQANAGKAAALTRGIAAARSEVVVLIDGDTVFEPGTVSELIRPFADPRVGAVAGNAKVGNRRTLLGQWQHIEYVIGSNLDRRMFDMLGCMPTVPGAVGAFRRNAIMEVGGVPGETMAEDTDLTMELQRAGWRVVYAENARAWTEAPASLGQLWKQRYRWCYGTLQAMYWHRRSIVERGQAGRLGRRGLPYLWLFQVLLPLLAPVVDVAAVYVLMFNPVRAAYLWGGLLLMQFVIAIVAFRLDREPLRLLWSLPLQQIVYRMLMYLVLVQSMVTAAAGARLPWHKLRRFGQAGADAPVRVG